MIVEWTGDNPLCTGDNPLAKPRGLRTYYLPFRPFHPRMVDLHQLL